MRQRVLVFLSGLTVLAGCASAPPAPAPTMAFEQKMAWILQLEDRRVLSVPGAPPAVVPGARRGAAAPAPPPAPDLARLTTDTEPRVRRRAALAVGRVGLKEGTALLTPLLADADADVRQAAAFGLGLIGEASAATALAPLLADPVPLVRGRAAEALGAIDAKEAAAAIGKMAAEYGRSAAVAAMQPDDEGWPAAPEADAFKLGIFALVKLRAYDALAAAVLDDAGRPITSWWPVAYALRRIEDARAAPALRALVGVNGRYTPAFAVRGLGVIKDAQAGPLVLPLLEPGKTSREVVAEALRAAGALGVMAAAERAAAIAGDARAEGSLRLEALETLGALKASEHVPLVQDLITDDWPALRAAALRAAARIDPEGFALVLSGLDLDRHWLVRAALADVLATLPPEVAVERVRPLLQDEDKRVVPAALRALVRLKVADAAELLLAHLRESSDVVVRETAARLLGESKAEGAVPALRSAYEAAVGDASYGVRAAVVGALAAYGTPEALAGVRAALTDGDWAVRVEALRLLSKLEPGVDHRLAARPVPNQPVVPYDDPQLASRDFSPHAFIATARGTIEFQLAVLDAPQTSRNFMALARKGFFNGLPVHRVVPNFVVQDGDPRGDGEGGPGYTIRDEINDRPYLRGTVGMALSWEDTGGSQFFITHSPQPHLDGRYTVFGHVVNGMDVVDRLQVGDVIEQVRVWDGKDW